MKTVFAVLLGAAAIPLVVFGVIALLPKTATVTGKVTYGDKPLSSGKVHFLDGEALMGSVEISADGTYVAEKMPVGRVEVCIGGKLPAAIESRVERGDRDLWRHMDPDRTALACEINYGTINVFNIHIKPRLP